MKNTSLFALLVAGAALSSMAAAQTIDTYPSWNGLDYIESFGVPETASYGQTFKALGSTLLSYTTSFSNQLNYPGFLFNFYVGEWDGSKMVGAPLYTSGPYASTSNLSGFDLFTVNTNLAVTTGNSYVAFVSTSQIGQQSAGSIVQAGPRVDAYADGGFVYQNNGSDFGSLSTNAWNSLAKTDVAFKAEFSNDAQAVPEPFTMGLLGMGALVARKRMKKS